MSALPMVFLMFFAKLAENKDSGFEYSHVFIAI